MDMEGMVGDMEVMEEVMEGMVMEDMVDMEEVMDMDTNLKYCIYIVDYRIVIIVLQFVIRLSIC